MKKTSIVLNVILAVLAGVLIFKVAIPTSRKAMLPTTT